MMRICPPLDDSSESVSFLKVDARKKQLTLYDPAATPHASAGLRRAATVAVPKIFAFDAVFPQDASQVRVRVCVCVCVWGSEGLRMRVCVCSLKGMRTS